MSMNETDKLMKQIRKHFGDDCIIVHNSNGSLPYYITSSALRPTETRSVLQALLQRWAQ